jgi:predicted GNAT family acetyltransferase
METQIYTDPAEFLQKANRYIESEPFSSSVIGVWVTGVITGTKPHHEDDVWITVSEGDRVVGAAMHTPPYHLFLARMPAAAAAQMARALLESQRHLEGVNGVTEAVAAFAHVWTEGGTGLQTQLDTSMRLYYVEVLVPPEGVSGHARLATQEDRHLVTEWVDAFQQEATPKHPGRATGEEDEQPIPDGLYLWVDGETVVSMARHSPPVAGVARVGPVYTPPEHRRHGYASAVTAAATQAALDQGARQVILYTDLSNLTSNAIYQAIGYVPDHDAEERTFVAAS